MRTGLLPLVLASLVGCGRDDGALRWSEAVTLTDGRVVTVQREQWFDGGVAEDGSGLRGRMVIRFAHPDTGHPIAWDSPYGFASEALLIEGGRVFILVRAGRGDVQEAAGCPWPLSMLFEHHGAQWMQVPLSSSPIQRVVGNMVRDPKASLVSIRGANYNLDASATAGASLDPARGRDYVVDLASAPEQVFRCPSKRRRLVN